MVCEHRMKHKAVAAMLKFCILFLSKLYLFVLWKPQINGCRVMCSRSSSTSATVIWTGYQKKIPVLLFRADALVAPVEELKQLGGVL